MREESISSSINVFAFDLHAQLKRPGENLFISPLSIFTAITMMHAGARTTTEEELRRVLHLSIPQRSMPLKVKEVVDGLLSSKNAEVNIANAIWTDRSYTLLDSFLFIIDENYDGNLYIEDFKDVEGLCEKINAWVSEKTRKKIGSIINPNMVDPEMKLILVNAIYFNGKWKNPFKAELTQDASFYLQDGSTTSVPMMHQKERFSYFEDTTMQVLALRYEGMQDPGASECFSMIIFLPREKDGLEAMEKAMTVDTMMMLVENLEKREVKVYIPRFKIETRYELKEDLKELGMTESFSSRANFSGIVDASGGVSPYIGEIIHKAFVDVNEEGTEAAAATLITMLRKGPPLHQEIPVFKADHPFMFMIWDSGSSSILFLGRTINPEGK